MNNPFDLKIAAANERLKKGLCRVTIQRRDNRLWLRGTLPPKPHINRPFPYQQAISLGNQAIATEQGLQYAIKQAQIITGQLVAGTFDWADWIDLEKVCPTASGLVRDWVAEYEKAYWTKNKRTPEREYNWKSDHGFVFKQLPQDKELTIAVLLDYIATTQPDTRNRLRACTYCHLLAEFARLEGREAIRDLKGEYSASSVDPRVLPTDAAIADIHDSIKKPSWRWVFGMMAAYGLRNHEVFRADVSEFPKVIIPERTKTGKRIVMPLHPEWAVQWHLDQVTNPSSLDLGEANGKLGTIVSRWFYRNNITFPAYSLRHCYARRCFEYGIAPDRASKLMGHSLSVHTQVYRAWFDDEVYIQDYQRIINRSDRPLPPS